MNNQSDDKSYVVMFWISLVIAVFCGFAYELGTFTIMLIMFLILGGLCLLRENIKNIKEKGAVKNIIIGVIVILIAFFMVNNFAGNDAPSKWSQLSDEEQEEIEQNMEFFKDILDDD